MAWEWFKYRRAPIEQMISINGYELTIEYRCHHDQPPPFDLNNSFGEQIEQMIQVVFSYVKTEHKCEKNRKRKKENWAWEGYCLSFVWTTNNTFFFKIIFIEQNAGSFLQIDGLF